MKLLKSCFDHSLKPVCISSFFRLSSSSLRGSHSGGSEFLLFAQSSSFCSNYCSTSLLWKNWCSGTCTFLSDLASRLAPLLSRIQLGGLALSLLVVLYSAWSSLASISSRASASSRFFFQSCCMKSKMLMEFMEKSTRLFCWVLSFSSTSLLSALVLDSPRRRMSSMSSSVMVPLVALKMKLAPYCSMSFISSFVSALFFCEFFCCWITRLSHFSFIICRSTIFSSTVFSVINRYTFTQFFWPMRCARSIACRSICGLKSLSQMTTVSAAVRLMPSPPARVERRKMYLPDSQDMNCSICESLEFMSVEPSILQQEYMRQLQQSSRMSSTMVICEKMSTLCPPSACSFFSSWSRIISLPEVSIRCSPMLGESYDSMPGKRQGWLHTFRSCISRFRQYFFSSSEAFLFCRRFLQILSCTSVNPTQMCTSFLGGRFFSTSSLVLRSMKGLRILCSWPIIWMFFFSISCSLSNFWSLVELNQLSNSQELLKISGSRKFSRLHNQCRLFWSGVPVRSSLHSVCSFLTTWESWLSSFLILWASSMTMQCHLIFLRLLRQMRTPSKLVTRMSNLPLSTTCVRISSRSSLVAMSLTTFAQGSHFSNSFIQLPRVILGAMMMCGPLTFLYSLMKARMEMVWMVLPRPISSARMPLMPLSQRLIIQFRPTSWQYFSTPPRITVGCSLSLVKMFSSSSSSSIIISISSSSYSKCPRFLGSGWLLFRSISCLESRKLVQYSACLTRHSTASSADALACGLRAFSCCSTVFLRLALSSCGYWGFFLFASLSYYILNAQWQWMLKFISTAHVVTKWRAWRARWDLGRSFEGRWCALFYIFFDRLLMRKEQTRKQVILVVILCLSAMVANGYMQSKVNEHFEAYDLNKDGQLERTEYVHTMQEEDRDNELDYEQEYYIELTELLYSQYDINNDGALNKQEWHEFARDILDQSTEQYQELLANPKINQAEL